MKKILIISILCSYVLACVGVSLNYSYCCDQLKSVSFMAGSASQDCPDHQQMGKEKCCHNKVVTVKLKLDQKQNDLASYQFKSPVSHNIQFASLDHSAVLPGSKNQEALIRGPAPGNPLSRQILFCVFRL